MTTVLRSHSELETLPGGKYRLTQYIKPIAYDHSGAWTRITNVLGNSGDPNFPIGTDELLQFRVRNRLAGQSPMLHFGKGHHSLWATLLDTNNTDGIVNGAAILFPNAWNNADFELILAGHKIKGNVYLRSGHPQTYRLRIDESTGFDPATLMLGDVARILPPVLLPPASNPTEQIPLSWVITQQGGKWILAVTLPQGNYAGWVLDPTLTLQPDATDGLDTIINPAEPDTNNATNSSVAIGNSGANTWRELIKFSLADLPGSAVISSTTFSLYATTDYSANARTFRIYRQKRAWIETQATWNNYVTGSAWQTAGGFGADDCEQTDIGSRAFTATETLNEFKDFSLTPTTKAALDLGNGWLLKADTESGDAYLFSSSDAATAADRPRLVVEYTLPKAFARAPMWGRF